MNTQGTLCQPVRLRRGALRQLLLIGALIPFPLTALAATVAEQNATELDTLTIEGNRLYDMAPSEQTGGYTVDSATVGTKTPAALRDIPQSITSYTSDYIKDRNFNTLDELAKSTAGLRVLTNDSGRSSIYSRGYEYDEYNIDGLPAPMTSIFGTVPILSPFDRVEIMRGPSGLFNSTSELGGIVNMVRKRGTEDFQGHITGRYGSWDTNYQEIDLAGPLTESKNVRGRFVASRADTNGEVDYNANTDQSYYGDLDIDLSDATQISFGLIHQVKNLTPHNGYPTDAQGNLLDFSQSRFLGADWNYFDGKTTDGIFELTHRFDNGGYGRLAARASHREADYLYAFTGGAVQANGDVNINGTTRSFEQDAYSLDASYSQPFEALGQVSEFVVGADYKHYDTEYQSGNYNNSSTGAPRLAVVNINTYRPDSIAKPARVYQTESTSDEKEFGLYSKLTFRPIERLALIGGARVGWYRGDANTRTYATARAAESNKPADQQHNGYVTPYAGVVYDLDDYHSLYASYSRVYKPQAEYTEANGDPIDPREGEQYETGIKGSYLNGDINTRLSIFQLEDENRAAALLDANGASTGFYTNSGKTRVRGAEIEASGKLTDSWEVLAGYTYMRTENLSGVANTLFSTMPKHMASLWTKYTLAGGPLTGLSIGAGVTAMSDFSQTNNGVTVSAPGYATVDAKFSYPVTKQLTATLDVNNLLDKEYWSRVGSVSTFNFQGPSRSVMVGARYDF
ncbi:TonB-dependent siderophore receptor [Ectopseudomonas oleovorans]|uniref:Outer membrane receptor for ferric coprogen and ferric-rhodotorulic acid n=1 Tax=Ectopseudomonas oleovorans TaxID=301 RepID=A0A3D9EGH6_ECTOL|nr:TonB-dependent siderophore receptor [Pseudomonas oleovorans]RED02097.1 outer membrane receptor for ferric coprogen and ferric-rhodotorulic acid [Pseudomonas oleovorans]